MRIRKLKYPDPDHIQAMQLQSTLEHPLSKGCIYKRICPKFIAPQAAARGGGGVRGGGTCVPEKLPQCKQRAVDHLYDPGESCQTPLGLFEEAIVPLHPVPRLALFHENQTGLQVSKQDMFR
jgi:hypothetical protein